jgi:hypothetical protein
MIRIELLSPTYNGQAVEWERLAIIEASGSEVKWHEGDETLLDLNVPVANLRTEQFIRFQDDPEEWVRGLPTLFRAGDVVVNILEDTNPLPADVDHDPDGGDAPLNITPVDYRVHA